MENIVVAERFGEVDGQFVVVRLASVDHQLPRIEIAFLKISRWQ